MVFARALSSKIRNGIVASTKLCNFNKTNSFFQHQQQFRHMGGGGYVLVCTFTLLNWKGSAYRMWFMSILFLLHIPHMIAFTPMILFQRISQNITDSSILGRSIWCRLLAVGILSCSTRWSSTFGMASSVGTWQPWWSWAWWWTWRTLKQTYDW